MASNLTEMVRMSQKTKVRLFEVKGSHSCDSYIALMLDYFEKTGYSPSYAAKNPTKRVEDRIEDLIKIVKIQERDLVRPIYNKVLDGEGEINNNEQLVRLANENQQLRTKITEMNKMNVQKPSDDIDYKQLLSNLSKLIITQCDPMNFKSISNGLDLKVSRSFFEQLIKLVKERYVL